MGKRRAIKVILQDRDATEQDLATVKLAVQSTLDELAESVPYIPTRLVDSEHVVSMPEI